MKRIYYLILTSVLMGALSSSASASCERLCQVDFWKWSTQEDVTQTITELQSLVEAGHNLNAKKNGKPVLVWAVQYGHPKAILELLKLGANINEVHFENEIPLHYAAASGTTSSVKVLLEHGAWIDHIDTDGNTPLMWAVRRGQVSNTDLLLLNGANAKLRNVHRQTALHFALSTLNPEADIVQALLKSGADPNAKDKDGNTALHLSHHYTGNCPDDDQITNIILKLGGDKTLENNLGETFKQVRFYRDWCQMYQKHPILDYEQLEFYYECTDGDQTTLSQAKCARIELEQWEDVLADIDAYVINNGFGSDPSLSTEQYLVSQEAWRIFVAIDCRMQTDAYKEGSFAQVVQHSCPAQKAKARVHELMKIVH